MRREIVLPSHLYDRIKASAGEHGGIGMIKLFSDSIRGTPFCAHGHAWGTCTRYAQQFALRQDLGAEPELHRFLTVGDNDDALCNAGVREGERIPFAQWCELLNVKCGSEVPAKQTEEMAAV